MHRRVIELAAQTDRDTFSVAVPTEDIADAETLADAQGWRLAEQQPHATGALLTFVRADSAQSLR